jgi:hypothetical protein
MQVTIEQTIEKHPEVVVREQELNHVRSVEQNGDTVVVEFQYPGRHPSNAYRSTETTFTDSHILSVEEANA